MKIGILIIWWLSLCGSTLHSHSYSETKNPSKVVPHDTIVAPQVLYSIEKTPCFGTCPVFEMRIYKSGLIVYRGVRHVAQIGVFESQLTESTMNLLAQKVVESDFESFSSIYPEHGFRIPDFPETITHVAFGNQLHKVINNHEAPRALLEFESILIDLVDQLDWVPSFK